MKRKLTFILLCTLVAAPVLSFAKATSPQKQTTKNNMTPDTDDSTMDFSSTDLFAMEMEAAYLRWRVGLDTHNGDFLHYFFIELQGFRKDNPNVTIVDLEGSLRRLNTSLHLFATPHDNDSPFCLTPYADSEVAPTHYISLFMGPPTKALEYRQQIGLSDAETNLTLLETVGALTTCPI